MSMRPASVVLVNYNGSETVLLSADCLLAQDHADYEVVVVDNGSTDGSLDALASRRSQRLKLIASGRNQGLGAARNVGIRHARGDIVAFVDDDAFAERSWLSRAVAPLLGNSEIGVVASKSIFEGDREILNSLGGRINLQGYGMDLGFGEPLAFWKADAAPLYATGNGLVTTRAVLDRIGGFDPLFFNYYDDVDFCIRAWKSGYGVAVAPDAVLYHVLSRSDRAVGRKAELCERNRIRNVLKHYDGRMLLSWLRHELPYEIWSSERTVGVGTFARAWLWNIAHLPSAAACRMRASARRLGSHTALERSWGTLPGKYHNMTARPAAPRAAEVDVGRDGDGALRYGWYGREEIWGEPFRWSDDLAAIRTTLTEPRRRVAFHFIFPPGVQACDVHVLALDAGTGVTSRLYRNGRHGFCDETAELPLPAGTYEILFQPDTCHHEARGARRRLGIGLSRVAFLP